MIICYGKGTQGLQDVQDTQPLGLNISFDFIQNRYGVDVTTHRINVPVLKEVYKSRVILLEHLTDFFRDLSASNTRNANSDYDLRVYVSRKSIHNVQVVSNSPIKGRCDYCVHVLPSTMTQTHAKRFSLFLTTNKDLVDTTTERLTFDGDIRLGWANNFYYTLEFIHSVYMFTKYHTSIAMFTTVTNKERLRNSYMDYVGTNRDYKRLYKQTI